MSKMKRRTLLIEVWTPAGPWNSDGVQDALNAGSPGLEAVVFGQIAGSDVDAAYKKLSQLSREIEATPGPWSGSVKGQVHSAHKALSFFRDMIPGRWWKENQIGEPR